MAALRLALVPFDTGRAGPRRGKPVLVWAEGLCCESAAVVDPGVAAAIASWAPAKCVPVEPAELVLSTAKAWVTTTVPTSASDARRLLRAVVWLAVWVYSSIGDLDAETVLCPTNTELWAVKENKHRSAAWRRDTRAGLRRVGRAVNPDGWPAVPQSLNRASDSHPVTAPLKNRRFKLVAGLTGYTHRPARMWIAAGSLGAGLAGTELGSAHVDDVVDEGDRLAIRVRGRNSRIVPVRACWTDTLKEAVAATKAEQNSRFVVPKGRNSVYRFVKGIAPVNGSPLGLSRARATWLTAHLTAGTPLAVLKIIAGPLSGEHPRRAG